MGNTPETQPPHNSEPDHSGRPLDDEPASDLEDGVVFDSEEIRESRTPTYEAESTAHIPPENLLPLDPKNSHNEVYITFADSEQLSCLSPGEGYRSHVRVPKFFRHKGTLYPLVYRVPTMMGLGTPSYKLRAVGFINNDVVIPLSPFHSFDYYCYIHLFSKIAPPASGETIIVPRNPDMPEIGPYPINWNAFRCYFNPDSREYLGH